MCLHLSLWHEIVVVVDISGFHFEAFQPHWASTTFNAQLIKQKKKLLDSSIKLNLDNLITYILVISACSSM
jgi:hypothetical protein